MSLLNAALRSLFDLLLAPIDGWPPLVALALVSLVVAVPMLWVFKRTSDQAALAAVKRQIHACLFEMRLFNDDLRAIMRAQSEILRHNLRYFWLSLPPLAWMIVPFVLIVAQLQFHYGYSGLAPGQATLVEVELEAGGQKPEATLEAPPGVSVETPAVWVPSQGELSWRIRAEREGDYQLTVRVGEARVEKTLRVTGELVRLSPIRVSGFLDQVLYPAEPPLPGKVPIRSISVGYPGRDVDVFGWGTHWIIVFFVLTIVFAFALRSLMGVTI